MLSSSNIKANLEISLCDETSESTNLTFMVLVLMDQVKRAVDDD